jgi:signal transduction histidine kinase
MFQQRVPMWELTQRAVMFRSRRRRVALGRPIAVHLRKLVQLLWVLLLLVCVTAVGSLQFEADEIHRLTQAFGPAVDANEQVHRAMVDAQIGLNGYELSRDRAMLEPYFGAQARTIAAMAAVHDKSMLASLEGDEVALDVSLEARQRLATERWWAFAISAEQSLSRGELTDSFRGRALFSKFIETNAALGQHLVTERDDSRQKTRNISSIGIAASIAVTIAALIAVLVLGRRAVLAISRPLTELRNTLTRQRDGEVDVRANVNQDFTEMRSLAISYNALTEQNLALLRTQARALGMNELTFGIARAIRVASDTQQALDILCAELAEGLGADRVVASTFDANGEILLGAQWHLADLPALGEMSADLVPQLVRLANEVWLAEGSRVRVDFLAPGVESSERAKAFRRETGARAVIMAPIGFGDRVMGMVYVLTVHDRREWTESEASTVRQVAGFVARAIVEAENQAHQREFVERVQRLDQQKSDFLATVSHELRTPLTSIAGYLELLEEEDVGELTAHQRGMLEVISRSAGRLRSLIEDVMMLSRIEGGASKDNFVPVSIHALITRAGEELWPLAQSSAVELEIDAGPKDAIVLGDRTSLDRAVINILSNAIKFSRPGSVVIITSTLDQEARRVLITCQDHGVGIPSRDQADLFTRFFRASNAMDQAIPGTGLGLSIVKQIVEDHGGELRLTSVEGEGTTVVIDLPLCELPQAPEADGNDSQSGGVSTNAPDLAH